LHTRRSCWPFAISPRAAYYIFFSGMMMSLAIVATCVTVGHVKYPSGQYTHMSLWSTCSGQVSGTSDVTTCMAPGGNCGEMTNTAKAAQAFYLMTIFMCAVAFFVGIVDACARLPRGATTKFFMFIIAVIIFGLSLVAWPLAHSLINSKWCGSSMRFLDITDVNVGGAYPTMLVVWLLSLPLGFIGFFLPAWDEVVRTHDPIHGHPSTTTAIPADRR